MGALVVGRMRRARAAEFSGQGYITGTGEGLVTVSSALASRWVLLQHRATAQVIDHVFSAPDGTYAFLGIDPTQKFDLIGRDWAGVYNDVIVSSINPSTRPIIYSAPAPAIIGQPYIFSVKVAYGTPPFTVTLTGALPSGLTATGGTISGAHPTGAAGNYPLTITVTDAESRVVSGDVVLELVLLPLSITGDYPSGSIGSSNPYQYTISGGEGPYTVSILSGALPAGRSIDNTGLVTGTHTTEEDATWVVKATDVRGASATVSDGAVVS